MTTKLRVRFDGANLVPLEPVDLPDGQVLEAELRPAAGSKYATPAEVLAALESLPKLDKETADAFERALAEARIPGNYAGVFDDLAEQ